VFSTLRKELVAIRFPIHPSYRSRERDRTTHTNKKSTDPHRNQRGTIANCTRFNVEIIRLIITLPITLTDKNKLKKEIHQTKSIPLQGFVVPIHVMMMNPQNRDARKRG